MALQAVNEFVLIRRDEAQETSDGLFLPDQSKIKPAKGEILSVGQMVLDKEVQVGRKAFWNKQMGWEIEIDGDVLTVLLGNSHILAVV